MSVTNTGPLENEGDIEPPERDPEPDRKPFWRELPVLIVIAFAAALLIKTFVLQAFYIPSASMEPTLMNGDRVLVEKLSYRFGGPERGDVVVFERDVAAPPPDDGSFVEDITDGVRSLFGFPTEGTQDFIKRVMAVSGDTIEGRDGMVYVNGEPVDEPYLPEGTATADFPETPVAEGEIFVMGDNRGNSDDSRSVGAIPETDLVGRAFVVIWPPSDMSGL
ncbi:MAG: signal peptidase I [Actinobacteria bacterium]|nr:signal peptidase I [Actinomycetota bacterium]